MSDTIQQTVLEIEEEARRAMTKWQGLDQINTTNDFIAYTLAYLGRAAVGAHRNIGLDEREMLIKAGGLIISAIEHLPKQGAPQ